MAFACAASASCAQIGIGLQLLAQDTSETCNLHDKSMHQLCLQRLENVLLGRSVVSDVQDCVLHRAELPSAEWHRDQSCYLSSSIAQLLWSI